MPVFWKSTPNANRGVYTGDDGLNLELRRSGSRPVFQPSVPFGSKWLRNVVRFSIN